MNYISHMPDDRSGWIPHVGAVRGDVDPAGTIGAQERVVLQSRQGFRVGQALRVSRQDTQDAQLQVQAGDPLWRVERRIA
ncbi:MAG: hypothetical protein A2X25_14790 [Chloroflexi bacterium GWB2_49_20]|nr:MAG: hypothetical protein A2X25_14790 [Chloroflexi bacterium GWB2_49_20]OGN79183.1 MAG: hypothetical protein A2X26_03670 [Chloroflexi bacterium GWC2_49_37]OGN83560.1 MAG: hypothetical protein A2X27_11415 [Chloroflexi bacterium GWD2_49_16]HCC78709.1 hypothetical protein [Anaerolineae bacterium]